MRPLLLLSSLLSLTTPSSAASPPQHPLLPVIMPPTASDQPQKQPAVPLVDILGTQRSITTFFSLIRLHEPTESLLGDLHTNTTVLAPLNSAIEALPRKPWEDPADYHAAGADAYEGEDGRERAQRNLRRFVEAHLVTASPWQQGEENKAGTLKGESGKTRELWWELRDDGKRVIMPDGVEVDRVASQVANGEVWILKGVLNYS
ncbi:unnamed protein product [Clonostachys rhizophaga]|uniref:FAS1 domain-containing protein n=1 Tax=Clonostachys rhizophaga TaxID=160324 RepID=A0A9N9V0R3_9HYPO|nr:unnamed protein product [Clonostachys rhizophaga]